MLRFAADESLSSKIIDGLLRRKPDLDLVRIQDVGLRSGDDPSILAWAAQEGRLVLTHDVSTMTDHAYERVRENLPMPGVVEIPQSAPIGVVIEDLLILAECSKSGEYEGLVIYVPFK
jgi:hypothetical protein